MNILWGDSKEPELNTALANWVAARCDLARGYLGQNHKSMGVFDNGELIGAVVFHNYAPEYGTIELSVGGKHPRWLTRKVLCAIHEYVFDHVGCQAAVMRVDERNTRVMRILDAVGFDHVLIPRMRGRYSAERLFILTDDDARRGRFYRKKVSLKEQEVCYRKS